MTGPTASGKSALALAAARVFGGTVINADAMQVYRELNILTARPDAEALAAAPHRLYGIMPGTRACSAGVWREMALQEIAACRGAGSLPILVGGTGLYLRALARGLSPLPPVPAEVRTGARDRHQRLGGQAFHAELASRDPVTAARLDPGDSQRLIRAWEILDATGRPLSDWQAEKAEAAPFAFLRILVAPPREALYRACDARFLVMMERGALDEVRALLDLGLDPALPVMRALGVRELAAHLTGDCDLETAVAEAQTATRRYAKRQITWLRTQTPQDQAPNDPAPLRLDAQYSKSFDDKIFNKIREFLLTTQF